MEQPAAAAAGGLGAELSDQALVGLYRDGAGEFAFAELVRRHQIAVFRLLLTLLGDADQAERACERVFFDAARRIGELEHADRFYFWMVGLARAHAQKLEAERDQSRARAAKPRPPPKNPRAAVKRQVQDVLKSLTGDERVALVLADLEGDSFEAIGATLGTSADDAEQMVSRARDKFVLALTQVGESADTRVAPAAVPQAEIAPPTLLGGRYRIIELLGAGGMGAVYRARDLTSDADVAVKLLLPAAAADPALRKRFEREAELIRRLEHPNFVRFVSYAGAEGEPSYVVMEFVDGKLLSRLLELESRLVPARALHITQHVLSGLDFAHSRGVVHRDIKPSNVMLVQRESDSDFAKILDLGIARALLPEDIARTQLTQKNEVFGTPAYMSPEQVRGEEVDGRSDLYSVAVMLFEMLVSHPPFQAKSSMAIFAMHLAAEAPALADVAPELAAPAMLQALLDRGLSKEREQRFASAREFAGEIERILGADWSVAEPARERVRAPQRVIATPLPAPALVTPSKPGRRVRDRLRKIPFSAAVALILGVLYALWNGYRFLRSR